MSIQLRASRCLATQHKHLYKVLRFGWYPALSRSKWRDQYCASTDSGMRRGHWVAILVTWSWASWTGG